MKNVLPILLLFLALIAPAFAASYSTEITMTPQKENGSYEVLVQVAELVEQNGKIMEKPIGQPKLHSPYGSPSSMHIGPESTSPNYQSEPNITVDVSWPKSGEPGVALCAVTIKQGDKIISKSKLQFKLGAK